MNHLTKDTLNAATLGDVVFCSIAESGAMGSPGTVIFANRSNEWYTACFYFGEVSLDEIFSASNLGIYVPNREGRREQVVESSMPYDEVQRQVRQGIEDYFKLQFGRPEILNRIGVNIVVFDSIRPEVATSILQNPINKIADNMRSQKNIELVVSEKAFGILRDRALKNLDNGDRGIGNIVESLFVNPLSRYMFDHKLLSDCRIVVNDIHADAMPYTLECDA